LHGTLVNGATFGVAYRYAIISDGVDDYFGTTSFSSLGNLRTTPWSFGGWFSWDVTTGTQNAMTISSTRDNASSDVGITTRAGGNIRLESNGGSTLLATSITPVAGRVYHCFATWDGTTPRLFVDGVQFSGSGLPSNVVPTQAIVGRYKALNFYDARQGKSDDIRIYNRAITTSEIRLLASRRGIAYELAPRRRSSSAVLFNRRRRLLLGAT
jgi:hypothetical protein